MLFNRFSLCIMVVRCFVLAAVAAFFVLKSNLNAKTKENIPFSILLAVCEYGSCAVHGFRAVEPEFSMHFQCDLFPLSKTKSVHNYFFRFCMYFKMICSLSNKTCAEIFLLKWFFSRFELHIWSIFIGGNGEMLFILSTMFPIFHLHR